MRFFPNLPRPARRGRAPVTAPPPMPTAAPVPAAAPTFPPGGDGPFAGVDPVTEMKLRTWARRRHCNAGARHPDWHPVVLDEMERIDREPTA